MSDEDTIFEIEGASLSLADIAGINMDEVEENRGGAFPAGIFDLEVTAAPLGEVGSTAKYPCVQGEFKVLNVEALDDLSKDPKSLEGSTYTETFIIGSAENLGSVKAMVADSGVKASGKLAEVLEAWVGARIRVKIRHKKNKDDPDMVNARIVRSKIKSLAEIQAAA